MKIVLNSNVIIAAFATQGICLSLLEHCLYAHNIFFSEDLLKEIWGFDSHPTTRTVDNFILKLRQKIEDDQNNPKIIITVHGIGYKLIEIIL